MKKLLVLSWFVVLGALFVLQSHFKAESTSFLGITDDKEQAISFEYPVEIVKLIITEGQKVEQGDILIKVRRNNLKAKQAILNQKIHELDFRNASSIVSIQAEIKSLKAHKAAEQADLDAKIQKLQAQYRTNKKLLADITGSIKPTKATNNPFLGQITELKKQRAHIGQSLQAQIDRLKGKLRSQKKPIYAQINGLKEQRSELNRQVTELVVKADLVGQVGNVHYKTGETVNAFQPILTIHAISPELVKGYINENVYNKVKAGQKVWVTSLALNGEVAPYKGVVANVGNRIVEYPQRLKKNILVPAWGREVLVRLHTRNNLLLGEKVNIGLAPPQPSVAQKIIAYVTNLQQTYSGKKTYAFNK